jgi:hypothetical protein
MHELLMSDEKIPDIHVSICIDKAKTMDLFLLGLHIKGTGERE